MADYDISSWIDDEVTVYFLDRLEVAGTVRYISDHCIIVTEKESGNDILIPFTSIRCARLSELVGAE